MRKFWLLGLVCACTPATAPSNQPPRAGFSAVCHREELHVQANCEFTDHSTDPDGAVVEHHWESDGVRVDYGRVPAVPVRIYYGQPGVHAVTLWVVDDAGARDTVRGTVEAPAYAQ